MSTTINWSQHSLDDLEQRYWNTIAPDLRRDGHDPHTRPPYQTLADLGYSGLAYALREHHDLTVTEFFVDVVGLDDPTDTGEGYHWGIDHDPTHNRLESYVRALGQRRGLAETTIDSKRTHLAAFVRRYRDQHDTSDLLTPLEDPTERSAEIERCYVVLDAFDADLGSDATKLEYLATVRDFYDRELRQGRAEYNPLASASKDFQKWERGEPDNQALTASDVDKLYTATDSHSERLLVVALAGWGLRSGEVARLHWSQVVGLASDDPHLAFESRKNGPSTVNLLYGLEVLEQRRDELAVERGDDWSGYLFPSARGDDPYITGETVGNRFGKLASRADVTVVGELPHPHMARRFWYSAYEKAVAGLLDRLDAIATDQGSSSAEVVAQNYLSEERRREARRDAMRDALADAFETKSD